MTKRTVEYVVQGRDKRDRRWFDVDISTRISDAYSSVLRQREYAIWPLIRITRRETIVKERIVK